MAEDGTQQPPQKIAGKTETPGASPVDLKRARTTLRRLIAGAIALAGLAIVWPAYVGAVHGYAAANATLAAEGTFLAALVGLGAAVGAAWAYFLNIHPGLTLLEPEEPAGQPR